MSFHTWMGFFLMKNTKYIIKKVGNRTTVAPLDLHWLGVHAIEVNGYFRCAVTVNTSNHKNYSLYSQVGYYHNPKSSNSLFPNYHLKLVKLGFTHKRQRGHIKLAFDWLIDAAHCIPWQSLATSLKGKSFSSTHTLLSSHEVLPWANSVPTTRITHITLRERVGVTVYVCLRESQREGGASKLSSERGRVLRMWEKQQLEISRETV